MLPQAQISLHHDLFRYWDLKRAGRSMPARRDIDPCEMPVTLLPHVVIIDQADGRFRYRLVGTAVVRDLGSDLTGCWVGSHTSSPSYATAVLSIYQRAFASARPLFTTGEHRTDSGTIQSNSRLLLPLSDDGATVNMVIFSRVARFNRNATAGTDWLKDAPGKVRSVDDVATEEEIGRLSLDWERHCLSSSALATSI